MEEETKTQQVSEDIHRKHGTEQRRLLIPESFHQARRPAFASILPPSFCLDLFGAAFSSPRFLS